MVVIPQLSRNRGKPGALPGFPRLSRFVGCCRNQPAGTTVVVGAVSGVPALPEAVVGAGEAGALGVAAAGLAAAGAGVVAGDGDAAAGACVAVAGVPELPDAGVPELPEAGVPELPAAGGGVVALFSAGSGVPELPLAAGNGVPLLPVAAGAAGAAGAVTFGVAAGVPLIE